MKIAIFTDIHGNKEALLSILEDIKKENITEIICLGDTIGLGPNSKECMDILKNNNINNVLGNHELYFLKGTEIDNNMTKEEIAHHNWVKSTLTKEDKDYLENCNMIIEKNINNKKILFTHFLIDNNPNNQYPFYDTKVVKTNIINKIINDLPYDLIFIGHIHNKFNISNKLYCIGSSGCRKDDTTIYTILDTNKMDITTKIIKYNKESFNNCIKKINYPDKDLISKNFFGI